MKKIFLGSLTILSAAIALTACDQQVESTSNTATAATVQQPLPNIVIQDKQVFPESVTSTKDGRVFIGSVAGNVYKAEAGSDKAHAFIKHSEENGILAILGVLADEASNSLWLCSIPNFFEPGSSRGQGVSSVMSFALDSGEQKGVYPFPEQGTCNDITIGADGTAYATDTPNGRIYSLKPNSDALELFAEDEKLNGIDGIAFSESGVLYANNVQTSKIFRVDVTGNGSFDKLVEIKTDIELGGPDSMRLISGNSFLQAESGASRLSIVTIDGDNATMKVLKDDLISSPGATPVGDTAYVIESNIQYLFNPDLRGQDPGDFVIYAVPMN